uniref:Uncharacterized protein n=1 Tax=Anguilla anguilla TaxID=7936 RepID=A0A0E9SPN4_ANGAN
MQCLLIYLPICHFKNYYKESCSVIKLWLQVAKTLQWTWLFREMLIAQSQKV